MSNTSTSDVMAVPIRGGLCVQARLQLFWVEPEVSASVSARILANGKQVKAFAASSQACWVEEGALPVVLNLLSSNTTSITVEVTAESDSRKFPKKTVARGQFLFWDIITEKKTCTIALFTAHQQFFGKAKLRVNVNDMILSGLIANEKGRKQPAPTFDILLSTIEMLQGCTGLHSYLPRLIDLHLRLLWERLEGNWSNQLEHAAKEGINAQNLRNNAVEDLLTAVHAQVDLLVHIVPFVNDGSVKPHNVHNLLYSLAESAATIYAWSEHYVSNTYQSVEVYGEIGALDMFIKLQQGLLYDRLQVLVEYHKDYNVVFGPKLVSQLFTLAVTEYRAREDWTWASYTATFGSLRYTDADKAFGLILSKLIAHNHATDTTFRDFLRRLMAHTMHFARRPPNQLDLGRIDLAARRGAPPDAPPEPVGHGSYGMVYRGYRIRGGSSLSEEVAVKCLGSNQSSKEKLYPEIVNCYTLKHPNVLPLKGISYWTGSLALVFPWMDNGTIVRYVQQLKTYGTPGLGTRTVQWMYEVANGLLYIHREGIVHGDLRGSNVLVSREGHAQLSDFGLSVYANGHSGNYNSTRQGNDGWTAPEIQQPEGGSSRPTRKSDIFSFAILCLEIYTGEDPWSSLDLDPSARGQALCKGMRPHCPSSPDGLGMMPSDLWALVSDCWVQSPDQRPEVHQILNRLELLL